MRFKVLTLTPEIHDSFLADGVLARAQKQGLLEFEAVSMRQFSERKDRRVDERPYGGGPGMVIRADVVARAINALRQSETHVVFLTPAGKLFNRNIAKALAQKSEILLVCGRYEGFDARIFETHCDEEISIGDYILSGGDLAAQVVIDAVARYIPGVLGNEQSAACDSFEDGLLEAPSYTFPLEFEGKKVPEVLRSGNHAKIADYRRLEKIRISASRRPDLISNQWNNLSEAEKQIASDIIHGGN